MKKHRQLQATSGNHTLLENGIPKVIGEAIYTSRTRNNNTIVCAAIKFHYGSKHEDYFYFENDELIVSTVFDKREKYILDCYHYCLNEMPVRDFVERVIEVYTFHELGF